MSIRVKREDLLNELEAIRPGLSKKEIVEQSSCFVFKDGLCRTFNDEVACTIDSCLKIEGAVQADPLINILRKLTVDNLEVEVNEKEGLILKAKSRTACVRMENDVLLPIETVEQPKKWKDLPGEFSEAIEIVVQCASNDQSQYALACVHIHPEWVEACDNYQVARYPIETGIKNASLVQQTSIRNIVELGMNKFSETETWLHFKNARGLILSCRRTVDEYPSLNKLLKVKGVPATLPKGLAQATEMAEVFSAENADNNQVTVELRPNKGGQIRVTGEGASGWYKEHKKLKYKGDPMKFKIAPKLLIEIGKRHNECELSSRALLVNGGKFTYVSCLSKVEG
jgi:DNA polymerase III sliding clamp (beta) subunit (PCNA family)